MGKALRLGFSGLVLCILFVLLRGHLQPLRVAPCSLVLCSQGHKEATQPCWAGSEELKMAEAEQGGLGCLQAASFHEAHRSNLAGSESLGPLATLSLADSTSRSLFSSLSHLHTWWGVTKGQRTRSKKR